VQDGAFHAGHELYDARIANVLDQLVDDGIAQFAVSHLATTEAKAGLHLVAVIEESDSLIFLGLIVMLIHRDGELDLLDHNDLLLLLSCAVALFLLVEIAAVILNAADGRDRVGRNFDQIEAALAGDSQRFKGGKNAHLFAVFVDYADFTRANSIIDADKRLC